jgi:5-(carboxyamino)imidazole ribonucleotide mutase/phosphoribosylaminoimidazole-succinocarboxamide synthase
MPAVVVVITGSPSDTPFREQITGALDELGIAWETRIASAHKTPARLIEMLREYEADPRPKVYVTVAGRSNALSGMVDAQVGAPVIACPPYSAKFAGGDLLSSLRTPSGVAPAVVLEPQNAALLAAKILGLADPDLLRRVQEAQRGQRQRLNDADAAMATGA